MFTSIRLKDILFDLYTHLNILPSGDNYIDDLEKED